MQPDRQAAMRNVLDRGPDLLADGLFEGSRPAQLRALKAYANTISHARYVALEDTYPLTRKRIGPERFHRLAELHLADPAVVHRPLRQIGANFAALAKEPEVADLIDAEWAMLEAHGAEDAPALTFASIRDETPEGLVEVRAEVHPATNIVPLRNPDAFSLEHLPEGQGGLLLVTRPDADVITARIGEDVAKLVEWSRRPTTLGALLERHADAVTIILEAGALRPAREEA